MSGNWSVHLSVCLETCLLICMAIRVAITLSANKYWAVFKWFLINILMFWSKNWICAAFYICNSCRTMNFLLWLLFYLLWLVRWVNFADRPVVPYLIILVKLLLPISYGQRLAVHANLMLLIGCCQWLTKAARVTNDNNYDGLNQV